MADHPFYSQGQRLTWRNAKGTRIELLLERRPEKPEPAASPQDAWWVKVLEVDVSEAEWQGVRRDKNPSLRTKADYAARLKDNKENFPVSEHDLELFCR